MAPNRDLTGRRKVEADGSVWLVWHQEAPATWDKLCSAYTELVKEEEDRSCLWLQAEAQRRLLNTLRRQFGSMPLWELEEVAEQAAEGAFRRRSRLATWRELWCYARKGAIRLTVRRRARNRKLVEGLVPEQAAARRIEAAACRAVDFEDEFRAFLSSLTDDLWRVFRTVVKSKMVAPEELGVHRLAATIGVSVSTYERRLRTLKALWRLRFEHSQNS